MKIVKIAVALIVLIMSSTSFALSVGNLYHTNVTLNDQGQRNLQPYLKTALQQVLLKVTGKNDHAESFAELPADTIQKMVESYSFSEDSVSIDFEQDKIRQLLQERKIPRWGDERPLLLIWSTQEQDGLYNFIGAETDAELTQAIQLHAKELGLPVELPFLDIEDLNIVDLATVQLKDWEAMARAGKRYHAAGALVVQVQQNSDGGWNSEWSLHLPDKSLSWTQEAGSRIDVYQLGLDNAARLLAENYAQVESGQESTMQVVVKNVKTYRHYQRVSRYLKNLSPVKRLDIVKVTPDSVTYDIETDGGRRALRRVIATDSLLTPESQGNDKQNELEYRLSS